MAAVKHHFRLLGPLPTIAWADTLVIVTATNSIFVIFPYRAEGTWVFDDERVGLVREPFVSAAPFPGYTIKLAWRRRIMEAIGTSPSNWARRVGCARRC